MDRCHDSGSPESAAYHGRILRGAFSPQLKERVKGAIAAFGLFEETGNPAIPYISAWPKGRCDIWYEYAGRGFAALMGCAPEDLPEAFRQSIIDQILYKHRQDAPGIGRQIISGENLDNASMALRKAAEATGIIDAVYKLSPRTDEVVWLKDRAVVETFHRDGICLSLGSLTVVTLEMQCGEERLAREKLQVALETAGGVCHEFNQPLQAVAGFSELLMMDLPPEHPHASAARSINEQVLLMGEITRKLMEITEYRTRTYVGGSRIVDIRDRSD